MMSNLLNYSCTHRENISTNSGCDSANSLANRISSNSGVTGSTYKLKPPFAQLQTKV
ncbi:uncharacterized protein SPAPADRAFT_63668 [Spathaspora passalidarum NRRL Y-27907]|uniref:Uncharacterized protein n=1 Tax=Spathaspora passalidarum (strain NRRL Y-27907 / 11-Y1) TaxID=619300 RepID=G3AUW1_SPAPN|nr:uncharacterized protein SPAPADRAFT_63668 [Spathaspora passalidarum NRRL Y-27907]EGW30052.1 hypothetical protein SPAPADRAFT_63668 [Spathaspora passalidarum NRRL Y-27907]